MFNGLVRKMLRMFVFLGPRFPQLSIGIWPLNFNLNAQAGESKGALGGTLMLNSSAFILPEGLDGWRKTDLGRRGGG